MQNLGDNTIPHSGSILMGTVDGSIKLLTQIPQVFIVYTLLYSTRYRMYTKSAGLSSILMGTVDGSIKLVTQIPQVSSL